MALPKNPDGKAMSHSDDKITMADGVSATRMGDDSSTLYMRDDGDVVAGRPGDWSMVTASGDSHATIVSGVDRSWGGVSPYIDSMGYDSYVEEPEPEYTDELSKKSIKKINSIGKKGKRTIDDLIKAADVELKFKIKK